VVLILVGAAQATLCQIRIQPTACPKAGAVRLADVADITAENAEIKERLSNIVVAQLPGQLNSPVGETLQNGQVVSNQASSDIVISLFDISRSIAQSGINPAAVDIFGACMCRLTPDTTALSKVGASALPAEQKKPSNPDSNTENTEIEAEATVVKSQNTLADQIIREITLSTRLDPARLVVDWNRRDRQFLQQEFEKERYRIEPRSPVTLGRVSFAIVDTAPCTGVQSPTETRPRSVVKRSVRNVTAVVEYLCQAVIAINSLPANHIITAEDVRIDISRISSLSDMTPADLGTIIGKKTARPIAANKVIKPSLIKKIFLVKRNDYVKVSSQAGSINIILRGKALADGGMGDTISIARDNCKNNVVRAIVTGPGTVRTIAGDKQVTKVATTVTAAATAKLGNYKTSAGLMCPASDFSGSISVK
ncbi:MAG: flagellar basal body P-ring formation protein FlgA, partial [Sedimentisphaerales bacterium]|nr:flagellar basal body P-ring formation protein FlgA [Sedimentisphaerales bacterium]